MCARTPAAYRFDWPRTSFLTFFLFEPRGVVRLALGAAFLREARFTFLRSALSSIFLVFANFKNLFPSICLREVAPFNGNGIRGRRKGKAAGWK